MASAQRGDRKKKRIVECFNPVESRIFIFSEGKVTEPNYFNGFKEKIESNAIYRNVVEVRTIGVGKDTVRILEYAVKYVSDNGIENAQIWCVYDKDSFPDSDFNRVQEMIYTLNLNEKSNLQYKSAWSNQCIELWFLLHFCYYCTDNDRAEYSKCLKKELRDKGEKTFDKHDARIFDLLLKGDPKLAIKNAENLLKLHSGKTDAKSAPATKVHLLVLELSKYLPLELKEKFC